jgi:hypothetical protein
MSTSTAPNVLSPGGSSTSLENDDLELTFATPVKSAGLDVVFDVPDGQSFLGVTFFDTSNIAIASNSFIPAPIGFPGFQFVGLVTDSPIIKRVVFNDFDPSPNDDHVAYDSVVFSTVIPEPSSLLLFFLGMIGTAIYTYRRSKSA